MSGGPRRLPEGFQSGHDPICGRKGVKQAATNDLQFHSSNLAVLYLLMTKLMKQSKARENRVLSIPLQQAHWNLLRLRA